MRRLNFLVLPFFVLALGPPNRHQGESTMVRFARQILARHYASLVLASVMLTAILLVA